MQEEPIKTDTYKTIAQPTEGLYKEKGSKFYGFAYPVTTVQQAKEHLDELKKKYHDARHYCFAYRINPESPELRANDDGEPSNSAGVPIYNQIQSYELWNTLIVVVRYFGGTKLGVSGLIGAYKEAAKEALEQAEILDKFLMDDIEIRFPYGLTNEVMRIIKDTDATVVEEKMGLDGGYSLQIRKEKASELIRKFEELHGVEIK